MTKLEEYPDPTTVSQCCAEPMYSQADICPRCEDHTGTVEIEDADE